MVQTLETVLFIFHFGGREYSVDLNIEPGSTPFIISRKALDGTVLKYHRYYKIFDRPEDGFQQKVEMLNYSPLLMFPQLSFLKTTKLQNIQLNIGYPSVEKEMRIVEQVNVTDMLEEAKRELKNIKKIFSCLPNTSTETTQIFSIKDPLVV